MPIGPYHTISELTGTKFIVSDLLQAVSKIPRSDVLRCLAGLSTLISLETSHSPQEQLKILHNFAPKDIANNIEDALVSRKLGGVLFFRRQLWFLWQIALIACKDDSTMEHNEETRRQVGLCCLMASEVMKDIETTQPIDPEEAKTLRFIATTMISHSEKVSGSEVIARCQLFWLELQEDDEIKRCLKRHGIRPIANIFEAKYAVPLEEFIRFSLTLYIKFMESMLRNPPSALMFDSTVGLNDYFTPAYKANSLKLLSTTPDGLAARLFGTPRQSWVFDTNVILKAPLLEVSLNRFVCFDLHIYREFLVQGIFGLLVDAVGYEKMKSLLGDLFQVYFNKLMFSFAPRSTIIATPFFNNVVFASSKTEEACDGLLVWPSFAILFECKTNMLTSRQRYAMNFGDTMKGIDDQIATFTNPGDRNEKQRKGIGQLAFNLNRVLNGEQIRSEGQVIDLARVPRLHPAVVLYDDDVVNHAVRIHLNTEMIKWFDKHGIDHSRVGYTLLLSLKDIEYLELLAETQSAEQIMGEYIRFVEQNPTEVQSLFHEFCLGRYPIQAHSGRGYALGTTDRILRDLEAELTRRKEGR